jgi:hypothetical protein
MMKGKSKIEQDLFPHWDLSAMRYAMGSVGNPVHVATWDLLLAIRVLCMIHEKNHHRQWIEIWYEISLTNEFRTQFFKSSNSIDLLAELESNRLS